MPADYKTRRDSERKNVKEALEAKGFAVRVKHGRGTASTSLDITVLGRSFTGESYYQILGIAQAHSPETISIDFELPVAL